MSVAHVEHRVDVEVGHGNGGFHVHVVGEVTEVVGNAADDLVGVRNAGERLGADAGDVLDAEQSGGAAGAVDTGGVDCQGD